MNRHFRGKKNFRTPEVAPNPKEKFPSCQLFIIHFIFQSEISGSKKKEEKKAGGSI